MPQYLLVFSQSHIDFRAAEFQSICQLFDIPFKTVPSEKRHLQLFDFLDDSTILKLLSRSMLVKMGYEVLFKGHCHEDILQGFSNAPGLFETFDSHKDSWCLQIRPYGKKRNEIYINEVLEKFAKVIPLGRAPINLTRPTNKFALVEDYTVDCNGYDRQQVEMAANENTPSRVYFCRFANLTSVISGNFALDPFCGTGGLLLAAAHFGASVLGTEIKYDVARAVGKSSRKGQLRLDEDQTILANFAQYGLQQQHMGVVLADSSRHLLWRLPDGNQGIFDAIITDPPYGIRERGQRLGPRSAKSHGDTENDENGSQSTEKYPEKTKYSITGVFLGLMDLSARVLCVGGRLSFWFPVCRSEYTEAVLPEHDCMRRIYNCEQILTRDTARRLLVYTKFRNPAQNESAFFRENCYVTSTFRDKIFSQNVHSSFTEKVE